MGKRFILLVLTVLLIVIMLSACGKKDSIDSQSDDPADISSEVKNDLDENRGTPIKVENLEELVLLYKDEYAALSEKQREEIIELWERNDFVFEDKADALEYYTAFLSKDAAYALFVWSSRDCVEYVESKYEGKEEYISAVRSALDDFMHKYLELYSRNVLDEEFSSELMTVVGDTYRRLIVAGNAEIEESGTRFIADAFSSYNMQQGAADAKSFFQFIEDNVEKMR